MKALKNRNLWGSTSFVINIDKTESQLALYAQNILSQYIAFARVVYFYYKYGFHTGGKYNLYVYK